MAHDDRPNKDIFNHTSGVLSDEALLIQSELQHLEFIDSMDKAANYMLALAGEPFNEARALPHISASAVDALKQKQREQDQPFAFWHLIYHFQQNLNRIDARIAQIAESLNALTEIKQLIDHEQFDSSNLDHKALLTTAGIDEDQFHADPQKAIDERFEILWEKRDSLSELREDMINFSQENHSPELLDQKLSDIERSLIKSTSNGKPGSQVPLIPNSSLRPHLTLMRFLVLRLDKSMMVV